MKNSKYLSDLGSVYSRNVLNEAVEMGDFGTDEPVGQGELSAAGEKMQQYAKEPAKFPGTEGLKEKRFYLPYIKHYKDTAGDVAAEFAAMVGRLAKQKLGDKPFEGNLVEFRQQFLAPFIGEVLGDFKISKSIGELTDSYIARAVADAFKKAGLIKVTKPEKKPEPAKPAEGAVG